VRGRFLFRSCWLPVRGFTSLELVATVAITLVVSAIAVSAYRTHSVRREVHAHLAAVAPVQTLVAYAYSRTGVPPPSERDVPGLIDFVRLSADLPVVAVEHGRIEIRFGEKSDQSLRGRALQLTPVQTADGAVLWLCGNEPDRVGLHPLGFVDGASSPGHGATTIELRFLPLECR
jgi:hypothetical protein